MSLREKISILRQLDAKFPILLMMTLWQRKLSKLIPSRKRCILLWLSSIDTLSKDALLCHLIHLPEVLRPDLTLPVVTTRLSCPNWQSIPSKGNSLLDHFLGLIPGSYQWQHLSLSEIDKLNYLRSLLQGPALDAIAGLTLTTAYYKEALSVLRRHFRNKQQIVAKNMDVLLNINPVTPDSNLKALQWLYNTIKSQVQGLKVSGCGLGVILKSLLLHIAEQTAPRDPPHD